jgi:tetratricopeptide (TPR) repeat protein
MAKGKWKAFPYKSKAYEYAALGLKKNWERLHIGDKEPFPKDETVQEAWRAYHAGDFERAVELGLAAGIDGYNVANKATSIYGNYLETAEPAKLKLYESVIERAEKAIAANPKNINAHYQRAYAMGRYSQGISIAKALAQGLGGKVKESLASTLKLEPDHAEAHIASGTYHAEIIDKVGAVVGGLTYGAKKESGVEHYKKALKLHPDSAIAKIEYANGLLMMFGDKKMDEATELYVAASECEAVDAMERLDVEFAKSQLEDE